MEDYKAHLARDRKLRPYFKNQIFIPKPVKNITVSLVWSILSQQLSIKVAKVLYGRFLALYAGKAPSAAAILNTPLPVIKAIGISQRKADYIHNVASFMIEQQISSAKLAKLSDEEVIALLTQIKGVGRWTVEMLLIFGLGRKDVFALDDLGIQKAMVEMFDLSDLSRQELKIKMLELSLRWSPYRTHVCLHLWNFQGFK